MSALFARLADLHRSGQALDVELHHNTRLPDGGQAFQRPQSSPP